MKKIILILFCLAFGVPSFAQSVAKIDDSLDDGVIGEIKHAVPLIGIDSIGKYLQSKIPQKTLFNFNNYYADEITFELKIDTNGKLGDIRPINNFQINNFISSEIMKNLKSITSWKPSVTIVNGHQKNINSRLLMFVYINKIIIKGKSKMVINVKLG